MERHDAADCVGHQRFHLFQRDAAFIERQTVETRTVDRGESLEPVERSFLFEDGGIALQREGRVEDTRAAAGVLLGALLVRRLLTVRDR